MFTFLDKLVQRGAALANRANRADDVAAGNLVRVGSFFTLSPLIRLLQGRGIDRLLNFNDKTVEITTRCGFTGFFRSDKEINSRIHRATACMTENDDKF